MGTSVHFRQVSETTPAAVEAVLPALLTPLWEAGQKIVVQCRTEAQAQRLNEQLWLFETSSFLPHGTVADGALDQQPIALTYDAKNPNKATSLLRFPGTEEAIVSESYETIVEVFDGSKAQVFAARKRWVAYRDKVDEMAFYAHTATGWQKKG